MAGEQSEIAAAIEKDHEQLHGAMSTIAEDARARVSVDEFQEHRLQLLMRLRDFQNHLLKHFDLEEEGGFLESLVTIAPHNAKKVEDLEREHKKILVDLRQILSDVKEAANPQSPFFVRARDQLDSLFSLIDDHEARERELLQVSYFQDLGTGG